VESFTVFLTIVLSLLSISAHEIGHALAMHACRVPIEKISLLGFGPALLKFRLHRLFGDAVLGVHLIPLGAFVKPDEITMELLSPREQIFIFGAGPLASFAYAATMILISLIGVNVVTDVRDWGDQFNLFQLFGLPSTTHGIAALACMGILLAVVTIPRFVTRFLILPIGLYVLWGFLQALFLNPLQSVGGPALVITLGGSLFSTLIESDYGIWAAPIVAGLLSGLLGLFNSIPLNLLDGGQITRTYIGIFNERASRIFAKVTNAFLLGVIVLALSTDIRYLLFGFE